MEAATLSPVGSSGSGRKLRAASDERLVARLRAGDERCFEVIFDRYHLPLLSFCRHMLGQREEAEDALQQVFVSAHRQLLRDDRPVQLRPWLYAIARNRCLSVLRARRETVAIDDLVEPSADGLAVAAEVQQRQDLKDILKDLAQLPDDQRAALVLAELEDLSHEEIALALDVRKDKVKALVFQAREALMGFREARDADCGTIREQLATLRGGALRRAPLQRHLAVCPGCSAFKDDVKRQRAALGAVLPVVPALALRDQVLSAVHAASTGAGAAAVGTAGTAAGVGAVASGGGGSGLLAAVGSSSLAVKAIAAVAVVASAGGGAVAVQRAVDDPPARTPITRPASSPGAAPGTTLPASATLPGTAGAGATTAAGGATTGTAVAAAAKQRAAERQAAKRAARAAAGKGGKAGKAGKSAKVTGAAGRAVGAGRRGSAGTPGSRGKATAKGKTSAAGRPAGAASKAAPAGRKSGAFTPSTKKAGSAKPARQTAGKPATAGKRPSFESSHGAATTPVTARK